MSNDNSVFFDRESEIYAKEGGNLPHWHQEEKVQFVTFRLGDSMPQDKIEEVKGVIETFKSLNPEPWDRETLYRFRNLVSSHEETLLDNGYGSCLLKNSGVRKIIIECFNYYNEIRYEILAYVIMPNHIHMLIIPYDNITINTIMHSIKSYTANQINKLLGREGNLWQREYYDHIVRSEDEYKHYIAYIKNNPRCLSLKDYTLFIK